MSEAAVQLAGAEPISNFAKSDTGLVMMVYGAEGSGKTHFAGTGTKPLFISVGKSTDGGMRAAAANPLGLVYKALKLDDELDQEHSLRHIVAYLDKYIKAGQLKPEHVNPIVVDHLYGMGELILGEYKNQDINVSLDQAKVTEMMKALNGYDNSNTIDAVATQILLPTICNWGNYGFHVVVINHESMLSEKRLDKLGDSNYAKFHPWGTYKMSEWFKKNIPVIIHATRKMINTGQLDLNNKAIMTLNYSITLGADAMYFTKTNLLGSYNLPREIPNDYRTLMDVIDQAADTISLKVRAPGQPFQAQPLQPVQAQPIQQLGYVQPGPPPAMQQAQHIQQLPVQGQVPVQVAPVQPLGVARAVQPPLGVARAVQPPLGVAPIQQPVQPMVQQQGVLPQTPPGATMDLGALNPPIGNPGAIIGEQVQQVPVPIPAQQGVMPVQIGQPAMAPVPGAVVTPVSPVVAPVQPQPIVGSADPAIASAFGNMFNQPK